MVLRELEMLIEVLYNRDRGAVRDGLEKARGFLDLAWQLLGRLTQVDFKDTESRLVKVRQVDIRLVHNYVGVFAITLGEFFLKIVGEMCGVSVSRGSMNQFYEIFQVLNGVEGPGILDLWYGSLGEMLEVLSGMASSDVGGEEVARHILHAMHLLTAISP